MRIGKYAWLELERRYLLERLPADLDVSEPTTIVDRYITGSRLRLRRMSWPNGRVQLKLGQKYQAADQSDAERTMTNLYLDMAEFELMAQLPAVTLAKRRYNYVTDGRRYSIDVFERPLDGLFLAEIECQSWDAYHALVLPSFALREVTADPFFTGGHLITLTAEQFHAGLAKRLST